MPLTKNALAGRAGIGLEHGLTAPQLPLSYLLPRNNVTTITAGLGIYLDS